MEQLGSRFDLATEFCDVEALDSIRPENSSQNVPFTRHRQIDDLWVGDYSGSSVVSEFRERVRQTLVGADTPSATFEQGAPVHRIERHRLDEV